MPCNAWVCGQATLAIRHERTGTGHKYGDHLRLRRSWSGSPAVPAAQWEAVRARPRYARDWAGNCPEKAEKRGTAPGSHGPGPGSVAGMIISPIRGNSPRFRVQVPPRTHWGSSPSEQASGLGRSMPMGQRVRGRALQLLYPRTAQRRLNQPVEIERHDHPDTAARPVQPGRDAGSRDLQTRRRIDLAIKAGQPAWRSVPRRPTAARNGLRADRAHFQRMPGNTTRPQSM